MLARVSLFLLGGVILSLFAPWCLANNVLLVAILHSEIEITTFFVIIVSFLINENYDSKDHLINDYSDVQGGGGQFSSIHRRAAQAGTTLTQVIVVIALIFNIVIIITIIPIIVIIVIIVTIHDCLDPQMRNNFFENEDDSPLLVTSIDGISTQVSSSSSS